MAAALQVLRTATYILKNLELEALVLLAWQVMHVAILAIVPCLQWLPIMRADDYVAGLCALLVVLFCCKAHAISHADVMHFVLGC